MIYVGFPKLGLHFLGLPIMRILIFGGSIWCPPFEGNYHVFQMSVSGLGPNLRALHTDLWLGALDILTWHLTMQG